MCVSNDHYHHPWITLSCTLLGWKDRGEEHSRTSMRVHKETRNCSCNVNTWTSTAASRRTLSRTSSATSRKSTSVTVTERIGTRAQQSSPIQTWIHTHPEPLAHFRIPTGIRCQHTAVKHTHTHTRTRTRMQHMHMHIDAHTHVRT